MSSPVIIGHIHAMSARTRHVLLGCYVAGLLALTLAPLPQSAYRLASAQGFDKAVHFVLFGGFACLLYWSWLVAGAPTLPRVVLPSASLAALVEVVQGVLGYRTPDVWDFGWGVLGALAAYGISRRFPART